MYMHTLSYIVHIHVTAHSYLEEHQSISTFTRTTGQHKPTFSIVLINRKVILKMHTIQ